MDVTCESCRASYRVDDAKIPDKGIKAKCPKCGHSFLLKKPAPADAGDAIAVGDDEAPPPPPPPATAGFGDLGGDTSPSGFGGMPEGFGAPPPVPDFGGGPAAAPAANDPFASFGGGGGGVFGGPQTGGGVFGGPQTGGGVFGGGGFDAPADGGGNDLAGLGGNFQAKTAFEIRRTSGQEIGPFDMFHIKQMIYEQQLDGSESICDQNGNWVAITSIEELGEIFRLTGGAAAANVPPPRAPEAASAPSKPKAAFVPHESAVRARAAEESKAPVKTNSSAPVPPPIAIDTAGKRSIGERAIIALEHVWALLKTPVGRVVGGILGAALVATLVFLIFKKQIYHLFHWDTQLQASLLIVDGDKSLGSGEASLLNTAREKYRSALQVYPKGAETHARVAEIDAMIWWRDPVRFDMKAEAEAEVAAAMGLSPNDSDVVRAAAALALAKHDLATADTKAKVAIGASGPAGDAFAAAIAGDAALEKGDLVGAEAEYNLAGQKLPARAKTGLARLKAKTGDFPTAKTLADQVVQAEPDNGMAMAIAAYAGAHTGSDAIAARLKLREIAAARGRFAQERGRAEFFLGLLAEEASQPAAALGHYRAAVSLYPNDPEAVAAAKRLFAALHPDRPLDAWLAGISRVRGSKAMGKIVEGEAAYAQRDWQGAMSKLLPATNEDPGSARALVAFGRLEAAIGGQETAKAKDYFNKAIAADPEYSEAYIELSRFLLAQKDAAGARAVGEKAIGADPTRPENYEVAAAAAVAGKDPSSAEKWLQTATQIDPEDYVTWMNLGEARRLSGNAQGAIEPLERACDLKKDAAEPRVRLGNAWEDIGDLKKASDSYAEATKLEPENVEVATRAGVVMVKNGDYSGGKKALEELVGKHGEIAEAHFFLGVAYQYTAEPDKALESYRQAIKRDYRDAYLAHYHSAELLAVPGAQLDKDGARDHLHEAVRLKPDFYQSHELLADIALSGNEYDEALKELNAVEESTAKLPAQTRQPILERVKLKKGRIATKQGKTGQAEKLFNEALKINPKSAEALTHLGDLYRDNEPRKAKKYYLQAIAANASYYAPYRPYGFLLKDDGDDCGAKKQWKKYLELSPNQDSDEAKEVRDALKDLACDR